ncbi:MAG: hypothetical protein ABEJ26_03120 [Halosimplex sp.]
MYPERSSRRDVDAADATGSPTRRTLLRTLAVLGTAGAFAGCSGDDSPATTGSSGSSPVESPDPASDGGSDSTPTPATGGAASFDCGTVPSALSAFESDGVEFSFAFDAPPRSDYGVVTDEGPVERVAAFYFARDGPGSIDDWDFNVDVTESVDTYGDPERPFPNATEVFSIDYDGAPVPVRHQAITDDQDVWVVALPQDGAYRIVHVDSAVMPGQFGCHDAVRAVAEGIVKSIGPR